MYYEHNIDFSYNNIITILLNWCEKKSQSIFIFLIIQFSSVNTPDIFYELTRHNNCQIIICITYYVLFNNVVSVIRKPSRKTSLFKFMTVLKPEVWLSIVAALTMTALMIWILDKYSPYSAQNNKPKYEQFR